MPTLILKHKHTQFTNNTQYLIQNKFKLKLLNLLTLKQFLLDNKWAGHNFVE